MNLLNKKLKDKLKLIDDIDKEYMLKLKTIITMSIKTIII